MAKKFNFRLNSVLRLNTHKVKVAEDALMEIVNIRVSKENRMNELKEYLLQLQKKKMKSAQASDLQAHWYHMTSVEEQIKKLLREIDQILELENIKRLKLVEAMKEERVMEKLKEKKFDDYKKETADEEMKELNEIATTRHYKANKAEQQ